MQTGVKVSVDLTFVRLAIWAFYAPVALRLITPDVAGNLAMSLARYRVVKY